MVSIRNIQLVADARTRAITFVPVFSTEVMHFDITGVSSEVSVVISKDDSIIFSSNFVPNNKGEIYIYDTRSIFYSYIDEYYADFIVKLTHQGENQYAYLRVFKTSVDISETAEQFLPSFFLSPTNKKRTAPDRYETLAFYPQEACRVYALASYFDGGIITEEIQLMNEQDVKPGSINTVDVSAGRLVDESKGTLVSFVVRAGERSFYYTVDNTLPSADPSILFRNCFNCWDTLFFTGTKENSLEVKRSFAYVDGRYRMYDAVDTESFKANSGVLDEYMIVLAKDLARARNIFLMDKLGNATYELVVTDSEIKYTNDDDSLPTMDFTFRRTELVTGFIVPNRPPKLFDITFDNTYN